MKTSVFLKKVRREEGAAPEAAEGVPEDEETCAEATLAKALLVDTVCSSASLEDESESASTSPTSASLPSEPELSLVTSRSESASSGA